MFISLIYELWIIILMLKTNFLESYELVFSFLLLLLKYKSNYITMKNKAYLPFSTFIFRTPLFPFNYIHKKISSEEERLFQNAIYIASPELYSELSKSNFTLLTKRQQVTIYKYFSRSYSRCTPFGLFAGCSVGSLGDDSTFEIKNIFSHKVITRLDMDCIGEIIHKLEADKLIVECLTYYPNDSIYKIGDSYRYVESFFLKTHRLHQISSVEHTEYLELILKEAQNGKKIKQLYEVLIQQGIEFDEAKEYIHDLIASQILVSNLQLKITGEHIFNDFINELSSIIGQQNKVEQYAEIQNLINNIDFFNNHNAIEQCNLIGEKINNLHIPHNRNTVLQVDLFKRSNTTISKQLVDKIYEVLIFLNKITPMRQHEFIDDFINKFEKRYEQQEVPILEALDPDIGIGFGNTIMHGNDDLIQNLYLVNNYSTVKVDEKVYSTLDSLLIKKISDCIRNGGNCIELKDEELGLFEENWNDLPETFTTMVTLLQNSKEELEIYLKGAGGESALPIIARFCHLDNKIYSLAKDIALKEEELLKDYIIAEIIYLPESHLGNILLRPILHQYEIPYLTRSGVAKEFQLSLSDIVVSIRNKNIYLRSISLNKYIIPRLSAAHYYSGKCMPLYQFLCYLQMQNKRATLSFYWGDIFKDMPYLPEVRYHNVILSKQRWLLNIEEINKWEHLSNDSELLTIVHQWQIKYNVSRYVTFSEVDNDLLIDLDNPIAITAFMKIAKKYRVIILEEYLFNKYSSPIKSAEGDFYNEFVLAFYKNII